MRKLSIALAVLLLAATASAQMMSRQQPVNGMGPMHFAVAADGSVLVLPDGEKLVALHAASGNVAWTLTLDGYPMQIASAGNQFFVMVADVSDMPPTTMPARRTVKRTLVAVSSTGTVLWSRKLD